MALKFSMILEMVDQASAPAKRIKANIAGLTGGFRKWGQEARRVSNDITSGARSLEHYERRARRLRQVAIGSVFRAASQQARQLSNNVRATVRNLDLLGRAGRGAKAGVGWMGGKALGFAGGAAKWTAAGASAAASFGLYDMFKTAGQFEQYQVMLEVMEGSAAKAKRSMGWIQNFAQTTPFELQGVTEAFTVLKNAGLDPTNGLMRSTGDAAAGMSADIVEAAKALADASNGQFERLIDLGITASSQGDKVRLSWIKNGKQIEKVASKSDKVGLAMAVAAAWSDKFAGSSDRQSKTMVGIVSNLRDKWSGFLMMIANAGIFDKVKAGLQTLLAKLDAWAEDGTLKTKAEEISKRLKQAWDWGSKFVNETNWEQVGRDFKTIADAAWSMAKAIAWAVGQARNLALSPIVAPEVKLGLKAAGWIGSKFGEDDKQRDRRGPRSAEQRDKLWDSAKPGKSGWMRKPQASISAGANAGRAPKTDVGGVMKLEVSLKGPLSGKVTELKSNNPRVAWRARTGKVMAGPA